MSDNKSRSPRLLPFMFIFSIGMICALFAVAWRQQTTTAMVCVTVLGIVGMVLAYVEDVTDDDDDT